MSLDDLNPLLINDVISALRRGTVPRQGLDLFGVGAERFAQSLDEELGRVGSGGAVFKALRGEFGCGKSFTARWYQQRALHAGFAVAEVQISENDTPLHRLETVYRRAMEVLRTEDCDDGAFRSIMSNWLVSLEHEAIDRLGGEGEHPDLGEVVAGLLDDRLAQVSATQPQFAMALRGYHAALLDADVPTAEGLMGWLMGQPNVGAVVKRAAGLKGDVDHRSALGLLRGLLAIMRQAGQPGLMLVLDEVETIQTVRADSRERSLNALRQLIDDLYGGRFPGLYVLITGTPAFFVGPQGVRRSPPLAQRLHVDFSGPSRFDNPRDVQVRLPAFDVDRLVTVGRRVRALYPSRHKARIEQKVTDAVLRGLALGLAGKLGERTGLAPRIYLRQLVAGLLDRVDIFDDFEPSRDFELVLQANETAQPKYPATLGRTPDDIEFAL